MAWTNDETARVTALEDRVTAIEVLLNTIQGTLNKFPTKVQVNALTNIRQQEIDELKQRVSDLETQVASLLSNV